MPARLVLSGGSGRICLLAFSTFQRPSIPMSSWLPSYVFKASSIVSLNLYLYLFFFHHYIAFSLSDLLLQFYKPLNFTKKYFLSGSFSVAYNQSALTDTSAEMHISSLIYIFPVGPHCLQSSRRTVAGQTWASMTRTPSYLYIFVNTLISRVVSLLKSSRKPYGFAGSSLSWSTFPSFLHVASHYLLKHHLQENTTEYFIVLL